MKTKAIVALFMIPMFIFTSIALGKTLENQTVNGVGSAGLHSLTQSSIRIVDNTKDNRGQIKKRNRLQEENCFSDNSCLQDRKQSQNRIQSLQRETNEAENRFQLYLRTNLTDTERNFVNTQLHAFRNDVDTLDNDIKDALRIGSSLQPIRDRISALYSTYSTALLSYINPSKIADFNLALQTILTNHMNLRQLSESRRVLSDQDESKIERFIIGVPPFQRLDYLTRVLSRVNKLMQNIGNSNMNPVRKERFLALLDDILMIVQARISDITSGGGGNTTPPVILSMSVLGISPNSATLRFMVNESGKGYYIVLASGSTMPTALQVKAGQDALGQTATLRESGSITSGTNQFALTGLSVNTSYVVYLTVEDVSNNLQPTVQGTSFITLATVDVTPPVISALSASGTISTGTTLLATVNEVGMGYYILLLSGSITPSATQVQSGQNGSGQTALFSGSGATIVGVNQFLISGLVPSTDYTFYFTAKDMNGNLQSIVQSGSVTTLSQ